MPYYTVLHYYTNLNLELNWNLLACLCFLVDTLKSLNFFIYMHVGSGCPWGWYRFRDTDRCYYVSGKFDTYEEGQKFCASKNSHLAPPLTCHEHYDLSALLAEHRYVLFTNALIIIIILTQASVYIITKLRAVRSQLFSLPKPRAGRGIAF